MKILGKLFSKTTNKEKPEDVMEITKVIGPLIEETASKIFASYNTELLAEPVTYIVPAVWGANKDGELTATQKEINQQVAPVIEKVFESLQLKGLSRSQEFSIRFLIRGLIISKILYMIEALKNRAGNKVISCEQKTNTLDAIEPLGTA